MNLRSTLVLCLAIGMGLYGAAFCFVGIIDDSTYGSNERFLAYTLAFLFYGMSGFAVTLFTLGHPRRALFWGVIVPVVACCLFIVALDPQRLLHVLSVVSFPLLGVWAGNASANKLRRMFKKGDASIRNKKTV